MNSVILEVGIGLALLFYVTATLVSGLAEGLTRMLNTRSKMLWAALERLLAPSTESSKAMGVPLIVKSLWPWQKDARPLAQQRPDPTGEGDQVLGTKTRLQDLAAAPSISSLDYVTSRQTKVSSIPGKVFASALLELAAVKKEGGDVEAKLTVLTARYDGTPLGAYLQTLAGQTGQGIDSFTTSISEWFDQQMTRVTQTYRKNLKYILAVLGLIVVLGWNIDTIHVAQGLARNADLRQVVTATAGDLKQDLTASCTSKATDPADKTMECGLQKLNSFQGTGFVLPGPQWTQRWGKTWEVDLPAHLAGLALTTGAVALGGPMWFDFLMLLTGRKRTG